MHGFTTGPDSGHRKIAPILHNAYCMTLAPQLCVSRSRIIVNRQRETRTNKGAWHQWTTLQCTRPLYSLFICSVPRVYYKSLIIIRVLHPIVAACHPRSPLPTVPMPTELWRKPRKKPASAKPEIMWQQTEWYIVLYGSKYHYGCYESLYITVWFCWCGPYGPREKIKQKEEAATSATTATRRRNLTLQDWMTVFRPGGDAERNADNIGRRVGQMS